MYLIGKLVLDVIAPVSSLLIICIRSGPWKDKPVGFSVQEIMAVLIFGCSYNVTCRELLILQDF